MPLQVRFVRSGLIDQQRMSARYLGVHGVNWSMVASSVHAAGDARATGYYLGFHASISSSSDGPNNRHYGFPIRCLAY